MIYKDIRGMLKIKTHTRHYYLGRAAFYLHIDNDKGVQDYLHLIDKLQDEIDALEKVIAHDKGPVLQRMW